VDLVRVAFRASAYAAIASEAVPALAVAVSRRRVSGPRAWVLAWCLLLLTWDLVAGWMGAHGRPNLWLTYILQPGSMALVLWALSLWEIGELPRLTMRLAIVPLVVVWAVLAVALEDTASFSRVAFPMSSLVGLGAAAYTLLSLSHRSHGDPLRCDWLWTCGGIALYFGTATALQPLSALLVARSPELVRQAFTVKAVLDIAAFLAIARGVTCRTET